MDANIIMDGYVMYIYYKLYSAASHVYMFLDTSIFLIGYRIVLDIIT